LLVAFFARLRRRTIRGPLLELARSCRMNFSPIDRFDLLDRLRGSDAAFRFAPFGRVRDVVYGSGAGRRHFLFTVEFEGIARQEVIHVSECATTSNDLVVLGRGHVEACPVEPYRRLLDSHSTCPV
jgi:hypothetical protein